MASILGPEWHISASGSEIITENGSVKDKQKIYQNALNTDIKEICSSVLSSDLLNNKTTKIVLQIQKVRNISAPKANEDSQAAPRMLKLSLSDGDIYVQALELSPITSISRNNTPPGTKIVVNCAKVCSGYLLLTPNNCTVLGGKVPALIEKWEIAKSVQRTNRRGLNDDGPPPWVNFGKRIQSGYQESNFKSLDSKSKEASKENAEFEAQRQGAIAEANSGAVKKVFGGMVRQNVQPSQNRGPDRSRDKKESFRNRNRVEREDILETPLKPEKVSLFSFLEDKLPVCDSNDGFSKEDDAFPRRKMKIPKEFQKPIYGVEKSLSDTYPKVQKNSYLNVKNSENAPDVQQNPMENIGFYKNHTTQNVPQDNFKNHPNSLNEKYQQKTHNYNLRDRSDRTQKYPNENRGYNNHPNHNVHSDTQKPYENRGYNNRPNQNDHSDSQKPYENRGYNNRPSRNDFSDTQKPYENRGYSNNNNQNEAPQKLHENRGYSNRTNQNEAFETQKPYEKRGYNSRTNHNEASDTQKQYENRGYGNRTTQTKTSETHKQFENRGYDNHANRYEVSDIQKPYDNRGYNNRTSQNETPNSQKSNNTTVTKAQPKQSDNKNTQLNQNKYQSQNDYSKPSHKPRESNTQPTNETHPISLNSQDPRNNNDQTNQNMGNVDEIIQGMERVTVNSQFASRSLRQHLNLGGQKKIEESDKKIENNTALVWNIGDDCLAKYWEDGKFYEATIMAITERTVAVKFRGYGNIEEILTTDCLPIQHSNGNQDQNRRYEQNSRSYTGSMQFRRTPKNIYNY